MVTATTTRLQDLPFLPYLNDLGAIAPEPFKGKIGLYAIFDAQQSLCYVGFSRDIYQSLKQHLVLQPQTCHWVKYQTVARPSRTLLTHLQQQWLAENGTVPVGNGAAHQAWTAAIDAKHYMSDAERTAYETTDEPGQIKVLRSLARRVEAEVLQTLQARGVTMSFRFDPKLKAQGLLALKAE